MSIRGTQFGDLMTKKMKPPRYIVDGLIPVGLTMIAGKPKYGKSWTTYDLAISVAMGRDFLGATTEKGGVLLFALEDPSSRSQIRGQKLLDGDSSEDLDLTIVNIGDRFDNTKPIEEIKEFVEDNPGTNLVVIDTVKHVRPAVNGRQAAYEQDYTFLYDFQKLAMELQIAIVVVYHTGKAKRDDPLDEVQGTTGITAACDTIMVLRKKTRDSMEAVLHITSRNGIDEAMLIEQDPKTGRWRYTGDATEDDTRTQNTQRSQLRKDVIEVLNASATAMSPAQVASAIGESAGKVRTYMTRMADDYDELKRVGRGLYELSLKVQQEKQTDAAPAPRPLKRTPLVKGGAPEKTVPVKRSLPKKKTGIRKLRKSSTPAERVITALNSKWTKPLSSFGLDEMEGRTVWKMKRAGEFSDEDYTAIEEYRTAQRQERAEAAKKVAPKPTKSLPRKALQKGGQRAAGSTSFRDDR